MLDTPISAVRAVIEVFNSAANTALSERAALTLIAVESDADAVDVCDGVAANLTCVVIAPDSEAVALTDIESRIDVPKFA